MSTMRTSGTLLVATLLALMALPPAKAEDTFSSDGVVLSDPSPSHDGAEAILIDRGMLYVAGTDSTSGDWAWRLEKRSATDGALVAEFGQGGAVTSDASPGFDQARGLVADADALYVVGMDEFTSSTPRWRIEKRSLLDGALVGAFGVGGVVTSDPSPSYDYANAVTLDGGFLYVAGDGSFAWRIEKRYSTTGALVTSFGTGGVVTGGSGYAFALAANAGALYVVGSDGFSSWRIERRDLQSGAFGYVVPEAFPDVGCGPQGAFALAVDGAAMYLAGEASGAWRIERRNAVDGTLVWAQSLPGTGSCDAARAVAVDGAFLFAAGRHGGQWRIEKRRLDDGTVVYSHAVASTYESANGIAIDERFVYMAGEIGINGGDSQWRIDRRRLDDGVLVGDVSATTTTVTTPATTTSTAPPGVCAQMRLDDCRIATALRDKPGPSDRFNVRCTVTLDPSSDGIDPAAQGVSFAMTDSNSPPCGTPCFAKAVSPQRIGRCWKYRSPSSSVSGLRSLKLCDFDAPHGIYRLVARSRPVDLQCLDAPPPYLVDLTIGNDCTSQCGSPMSTTTTTVSTTTTTLAGTCVPRTASRHASVITNVRGSRTWANPTNVRVADGIAASVLSLSPGEISDFLFANNLGFALPFYARVTGVMVEVKRSSASGTGVSDSALQLRLGQSERGSRAAPGLWSTTDGYAIYGGPGDLWGGYSWTPEQINSPDFGVALSVQNTTPAAIDTARVDHMRVTVFYVSATGAIGPRSPTVAVDDASIGTRSWATPGNALLADDAEATASGMVGSEQTHYLRVSAFGFGVPAGQTPSGILLEVKRRASFSSSIADNAVRLVRGGLIGTANRNAGYWESESVYQAYGGPDDPWNQTWSAADINSPSFGAAISARHSFNIGSDSALVDHIRLTIVYGAFNTQMTGNPGTAASEQNSEDWSSPGNAALPDLAVARSRLIEGTPSSVLVASAFNFALPPAAQVRGITLTVTRWGRDEDDIDDLAIHDRAIRLVKGGSVGTANRSHPEGWSTVASSIDYGGTADLWGDTWTASDINRADFGAALQAEYRFFAGNNDANVDAMRLTVDYCE